MIAVSKHEKGPEGEMPSSRAKGTGRSGYNPVRLFLLLLMIAVNSFLSGAALLRRQYPWGFAADLFLLPVVLRELDLRRGRPLRRLGPFEWSCFAAGFLFLAILPFVFRWYIP